MTLDERKAKAHEAHARGYNCAQSVLLAFDDVLAADRDMLARMAAALGSGVGASGQICGVLTGLALAEGLMGGSEPADKVPATRSVHGMVDRFRQLEGDVTCRNLKGKPGCKSCDQLIADGVEIFYNRLKK